MDVQQLFKRLKKEAECPLCLDTVKSPKTLPCLHSFCLECLDKLANFARRQLQTTIKCPVCQTSFPIPDSNTFANLPSSFHLNRLVDVLALEDSSVQAQKCNACDDNNPATSYCFVCQTFMCASCVQSHQRFKATRGHRNVLIDKLQAQDVQELIRRPAMCSHQFHEGQPLEFYCEDCKVLICVKCSIVIHNRHSVTDTRKAALEQKMKLMEAVAKLKAEILLYANEIKTQTELKDKNVTDIMNAEKKMRDSVEEWIRNLREHEKKMRQRFRGIYEAEQKQHETRLKNLELITTQLKSCVERGQGVLERNISTEILQTNHTILQRCDELINTRKSDRYKSPYLNYLVKRKFDTFDHIAVTKTDSSMCLAEFDNSEIGKESNVVVVTRDSEELQCYQLDDQIKVDILTAEGDHLKTELKDSKDGKYTVTYTPQCVDQHCVEIEINEQPITGSPFLLQIRQHHYQFSLKFGSRGWRVGEFAGIFDIAVSDRTETIAVADVANKRIQLFSLDGKFQMQVELDGDPLSVAFTDCGDLLTLVSGNNNKLHLFSEEGQFIKHINDKHLKKPHHLSIASDGRLIITDVASNEVKVLSPDGSDQLVSMTAPNCDKYPGCAIYHSNKFYVSYPMEHCIKAFDKTGVYLHEIGCKGSNDGQFYHPLGLVIDKCNRLIVCDGSNRRLQLFTLSGKFLSKLEGEYFSYNTPRYAALNNNGNLILAGLCEICIFVNSREVFDKKRD
ncbi:PREDICTED: E3 ubiquitin-protein ligase TRIM71-like isoform X2 [Acropora digitifera]|uniref:E3 ubiquitin-protein ligase TRIM71-like isoform X1 n=1 Tax=Acropora digitifera TaxID=70779 RepID=UPI00077A04CD|nr:PREDICTED: E3 ubiquitin-protein ligase TRIM71-like isoform X1 [Acropora digitifera]XP_015762185.1 PREDICTED: E3 ubiquitin-protein ligase TRIM71-like isoform X2 [Acropora digitifera]